MDYVSSSVLFKNAIAFLNKMYREQYFLETSRRDVKTALTWIFYSLINDEAGKLALLKSVD